MSLLDFSQSNPYEKKWFNFSLNYIEHLNKIRLNGDDDWLFKFFDHTIHLSTIILPTIVEIRFAFEKKPNRKDLKNFFRKINKISEKDYHLLIKCLIFDYFNQDRPSIREIVDKKFPNSELENLIYLGYDCSLQDKQIFKTFVLKEHTYYPTSFLLERLFFENPIEDDKFIELCEFIKDGLYNQFDDAFINFFNKKN